MITIGDYLNMGNSSTHKQKKDQRVISDQDRLLFNITKAASKPIIDNQEVNDLWLNSTRMGKTIANLMTKK